ncbi:MAG: Ig-like domain-containing protein [Lentilactobacillus diolivorans]|jgi:hypothetical protein|nr:Ig-like domain-containing protein [Lentilactobacillus diolivorans]
MKKITIATMVFSIVTVGATTVSAKSAVYLHTNRLNENSTYVSGKATPGAKIKMLHQGMVYANGKVNKYGKFRIALNEVLSANWNYTLVETKAGYKSRKYVVLAKPVHQKQKSSDKKSAVAPVTISNSVSQPVQPETSSQIGSQSAISVTSFTPTVQAPQGTYSVNTMNQWFVYQRQIDDLNSQVSVLLGQKKDIQTQEDKLQDNADQFDAFNEDAERATISEDQQILADANATANQKQTASREIVELENHIERVSTLIKAGQTWDVLTAEMKPMDDQKSVLDKQQDGLNDQIKALQSQQAALLK